MKLLDVPNSEWSGIAFSDPNMIRTDKFFLLDVKYRCILFNSVYSFLQKMGVRYCLMNKITMGSGGDGTNVRQLVKD
jgi:hypothetical protein